MNAALLDFSRRPELSLHADVLADVQRVATPLRIPVMIAGAFARDLNIFYAHGLDTHRESEDVDLGVAVADWDTFSTLMSQLAQGGRFRPVPNHAHRLRHESTDLPADLIPFAGVESPDRRIAWPPAGEVVMDVFGFREALAASILARLPGGIEIPVVSLQGLALLKVTAWHARHVRAPLKDAHDLMLIASNYLALGGEHRLWNEFAHWTEERGFDFEQSGARMLGNDIRALLDKTGVNRVSTILEEQLSGRRQGELATEMNRRDPDKATRLLRALHRGLTPE
ncbi:MAG TPA: nucleotidyl transferase AbiEii/AbiGii toxin family protein [Casimicrobiaceae bacterium]|nr:nucleotidyl transferase AbiEii/AbiGii toxin family protein [Casimicrobiaceae bacterium]